VSSRETLAEADPVEKLVPKRVQ